MRRRVSGSGHIFARRGFSLSPVTPRFDWVRGLANRCRHLTRQDNELRPYFMEIGHV
jgi:hypothetical protein